MPKPTSNDKIILTGIVGSHSYGTATSESDMDYMSVVIPETKYYLGLSNWGNSGTMKDVYEDSITGQLVEHQYYELKKFISMCSAMNPNAIPLLWLNHDLYTIMTPEGESLMKNRELFNSKKAYHTFSGFAHNQLQKMGGIFNDAEESNQFLKNGYQRVMDFLFSSIEYQRFLRAKLHTEFTSGEVYDEGYLAALIAINTHCKEESKRIKDGPITGRMGAKRKELREKYGYDCKFAYHVIRQMKMCIEFLSNPQDGLKVMRKGIDSELLYSIRQGEFTQESIKKMADELFLEAKEIFKTTTLPDNPCMEEIEALTISLLNSMNTRKL